MKCFIEAYDRFSLYDEKASFVEKMTMSFLSLPKSLFTFSFRCLETALGEWFKVEFGLLLQLAKNREFTAKIAKIRHLYAIFITFFIVNIIAQSVKKNIKKMQKNT